MDDMYIIKDGKELRCGYTTGSCAAAASKAAAIMLKEKEQIKYIEIDTPAGIVLKLEVFDQEIKKDYAVASIIKDGGDDPDNTDGMKIFAKVKEREDDLISIDGGYGIGRIKKKGLFGNIGDAAINPVPKEMIKSELRKISKKGYDVEIFAPKGKIIGEQTFNSNIGIEGGISIIGTKGIVYPMSEDAIIKTINLEIDMAKENYGIEQIILVPGNYGEKIAKKLNDKSPIIKISNYVGESLLYAYRQGFKSIKLIGHIGKFAKLAIGIFNTHSRVADTRMESFIYYLALMGVEKDFIDKINSTLTAEEAIHKCIDSGYEEIVKHMEKGAEERIKRYLKDDHINIDVIIYSMERGINL